MIADPKTSFEPHSSEQLPASTRVYVEGQIHKDVRVPMREIALSPTKSFNGRIEVNEPVRVYDTSGPWGDPSYKGTVEEGLPALRKAWILSRNDVERSHLERIHRPLQCHARTPNRLEVPLVRNHRIGPLEQHNRPTSLRCSSGPSQLVGQVACLITKQALKLSLMRGQHHGACRSLNGGKQ